MTDSLGVFRSLFMRAPVPYVGRTGIGRYALRDTSRRSHLAATAENSDLYSIVNVTSTSTAKVNWRLWRNAASGRKEDRREVLDHQALRVWKRPNDFTTGREFVEAGQKHGDLCGETWWVVERGDIPGVGMVPFPTAMWVVRPDRMTPIPSREEFLVGYMYTSPDGQEVALTLDQVIMQKTPSPMDPYRGLGPVAALMLTLEGEAAAEEWNANFFRNGAMPGGILKTKESLNDDVFNRVRDRWAEQHKGLHNAHRVAILEAGLDFETVNYSRKDLQIAEAAAITPDKLKRAFGLPGFALGELQDANRASSEAAAAWFAQNLTIPRLDRIKDALNVFYLPMFGTDPFTKRLEFDYDNPVEPDQATENSTLAAKTSAYKTLCDAGVEPEDAASVVGLPEMRHRTAAPAAEPDPVGAPA